jgi:hypothetical protein
MMRIFIGILIGFMFNPTPLYEPETVFIEYKTYVYKHDDIGLRKLSIDDVKKLL